MGQQAELPRPGEVICGKYRIDSVIGTGGMGVVLGATDQSLGRSVAIKFLSPAKLEREGAVARFLREARAAASIRSEHCVRVFEVGTLPPPHGAPFIVMEHLQGSDLARLLFARGRLPIAEACDYVLQSCEAIGEAHGLGIVHRDLKPQNLFLTQRPDGSPCMKVVDFGISKAADTDDGAPNLTSTDMVMGTPLYMSPEQVRSLKNVDARADIWALGSILFELLTSSPIFQAPSASALCAMIAMDPAPPLRTRRPDAPAGLEAVILRCLEKDPAARFPDVASLAHALAPFASDVGRLSATRLMKAGGPAIISAPGNASATGETVQASSMPPMTPYAPPFGMPSQPGHPQPGPPPGTGPAGTGPAGAAGLSQSFSAPPPGFAAVALPPGYQTQHGWQQPVAAPPKKSSLLPVLLVVGGILALLGVAVGGVALFLAGRVSASASASESEGTPTATVNAPPSAPTNGAVPPPSNLPPIPSLPNAPTIQPPGPSPVPSPPRPGVKDAGAPVVVVDAGRGPSEAEEIARKRSQAQQQCALIKMQFDRPDKKAAAQSVKTQTCTAAFGGPNAGTSNCHRALCRRACETLEDKLCQFQLDNAERDRPLPF